MKYLCQFWINELYIKKKKKNHHLIIQILLTTANIKFFFFFSVSIYFLFIFHLFPIHVYLPTRCKVLKYAWIRSRKARLLCSTVGIANKPCPTLADGEAVRSLFDLTKRRGFLSRDPWKRESNKLFNAAHREISSYPLFWRSSNGCIHSFDSFFEWLLVL